MHRAVQWQRVEGLIIFVVGLLLLRQANTDLPWWAAVLIFFAPDLSFAGYAFGPKVGAFCYNAVHVYAFGLAFFAAGLLTSNPTLWSLGALWMAHSGFDRMLGYGLKAQEGFTFTHLGRIGQHAGK
ncbi:DUF4260 domain-containing protein [Mycoplana dimorpha]|uniref:Uncharacterized protein DUF4260 n=1 Tax=Mycoplana dimorpha TaxID=28320 RepID=A0A2T5BAW2_MYCDI|nr:DUF4260 domain-containing protein [Mycoplana dimorpha]PTM96073.1 uncharacterized protein DUF4260 [Mycoplana dimorpha]